MSNTTDSLRVTFQALLKGFFSTQALLPRDKIFAKEQEYKTWIKKQIESGIQGITVFEIENEEKVSGMPDLLLVSPECTYGVDSVFIEVKIARDDAGTIRFRPSQLLFYHYYKDLRVFIMAYSVKHNKHYIFPSNYIVANGKQTLSLNKEKEHEI